MLNWMVLLLIDKSLPTSVGASSHSSGPSISASFGYSADLYQADFRDPGRFFRVSTRSRARKE